MAAKKPRTLPSLPVSKDIPHYKDICKIPIPVALSPDEWQCIIDTLDSKRIGGCDPIADKIINQVMEYMNAIVQQRKLRLSTLMRIMQVPDKSPGRSDG